MRFRNPLILVGFAVLLSTGLMFVGCSDDDTTPTNTNTGGSQQDFQQETSEQVSQHFDTIIDRILEGLQVAKTIERDSIPGLLYGPLLPPDSSEADDDWTVYFLTDLQAGGEITITVVDSLQYLDDGVPEAPGNGADQVLFKHYYTLTNSNTTDSYTDVALHSNLSFSNVDNATATVDGTVNNVIESKVVTTGSTVMQTWDIQATVTAFRVDRVGSYWPHGCPSTGIATVIVNHTYQVDSETPQTTEWTYTLTIIDGQVSGDIANDNSLSASYQEDVCTL